jgi:hypothetical protein
MGLIFKLLAMLLSLFTAGWAMAESVRRGLLVVSVVVAALKIIVFLVFLSVIAVVIYLLLKDSGTERGALAT